MAVAKQGGMVLIAVGRESSCGSGVRHVSRRVSDTRVLPAAEHHHVRVVHGGACVQVELERRRGLDSPLPAAATDPADDHPVDTAAAIVAVGGLAITSGVKVAPVKLKSIEDVAIPAARLPRAEFCRAALVTDMWPRVLHISNLPEGLTAEADAQAVLTALCPGGVSKGVAVYERSGAGYDASTAPTAVAQPLPYMHATFARADAADAAYRALQGLQLTGAPGPLVVTFVAPNKFARKTGVEPLRAGTGRAPSGPKRPTGPVGRGPGFAPARDSSPGAQRQNGGGRGAMRGAPGGTAMEGGRGACRYVFCSCVHKSYGEPAVCMPEGSVLRMLHNSDF